MEHDRLDMESPCRNPSKPNDGLLIAMLCLVWGSTWLAIKLGLRDMPPFFSAGFRFFISAIVLFALILIRDIRTEWSLKLHGFLLLIGILTFTAGYGPVYWAEQYISSGLAAVIFATFPFFVSVLAHYLLPGDSLSLWKTLGIAIGFAGIICIFFDTVQLPDSRGQFAAFVMLLSPISAALANVLIKKYGHELHPYTLTALPMMYGAGTLIALGFIFEDPRAIRWTAQSTAALLYLALFGSVLTFVAYYAVLKRTLASHLALITYITPIVAVALGYLILHETLKAQTLVGTTLVLGGVILATRRPPQVPRAAASAKST